MVLPNEHISLQAMWKNVQTLESSADVTIFRDVTDGIACRASHARAIHLGAEYRTLPGSGSHSTSKMRNICNQLLYNSKQRRVLKEFPMPSGDTPRSERR